MFAHSLPGLPACLPAGLPACLPACLPAWSASLTHAHAPSLSLFLSLSARPAGSFSYENCTSLCTDVASRANPSGIRQLRGIYPIPSAHRVALVTSSGWVGRAGGCLVGRTGASQPLNPRHQPAQWVPSRMGCRLCSPDSEQSKSESRWAPTSRTELLLLPAVQLVRATALAWASVLSPLCSPSHGGFGRGRRLARQSAVTYPVPRSVSFQSLYLANRL